MPTPSALPLPTLRQLEYVVAIADEASFGAAAAACHVSQPGLSAQVREVERLLDLRLFERDRRGVLITPAGEEVVARARTILDAARRLVEAAAHRSRPLTGPFRLGIIPTIAPYFLPASLPAVRRDYPELKLRLREEKTDTLLALLSNGKLDAALLATDAEDVEQADVEVAGVCRDAFLLALPEGHRLARKKSVTERDLEGEHVLLLEDGHCLRDQALSVCERSGADENAELRATSLATLVQMVAGGDGVTLLPAMAEAALAGKGSGVLVRPFRAPTPSRAVGLVWRRASSRADEMKQLAATLAGVGPSPSRRRTKG